MDNNGCFLLVSSKYFLHSISLFCFQRFKMHSPSTVQRQLQAAEGLAELISCYIITSFPRSKPLQCITYSKWWHHSDMAFPIEIRYRLTKVGAAQYQMEIQKHTVMNDYNAKLTYAYFLAKKQIVCIPATTWV